MRRATRGRMGALPFVAVMAFLAVMTLLAGCEIDYEGAELREELSESTPELVLDEPQYVFIRNSARVVRVSARQAEFFGSSSMQTFVDLAFLETDRDNNTLNSGSADRGIYFTDSGNFELVGNVIFQSIEQDATVYAQYILWDNEEQQLFGKEDEKVRVTRPSGTVITGFNLNANLMTRIIELEQAEGIVFPEDEDEDE